MNGDSHTDYNSIVIYSAMTCIKIQMMYNDLKKNVLKQEQYVAVGCSVLSVISATWLKAYLIYCWRFSELVSGLFRRYVKCITK